MAAAPSFRLRPGPSRVATVDRELANAGAAWAAELRRLLRAARTAEDVDRVLLVATTGAPSPALARWVRANREAIGRAVLGAANDANDAAAPERGEPRPAAPAPAPVPVEAPRVAVAPNPIAVASARLLGLFSVDRLTLSQRLHGLAAQNTDGLRRQLVASVRAGESMAIAARRIAEADVDARAQIPAYVSEIAEAAAAYRASLEGDGRGIRAARTELGSVVARWLPRIRQLGEREAGRPGPGFATLRSASLAFVEDLTRSRVPDVDAAVNRWILERATYQARVVARTEIAGAWDDLYVARATQRSWVVGFRWRLSNRHPKPDVCDVYARADAFGLGPGGYPAGPPENPHQHLPRRHPNCLCTVTAIRDPHWRERRREGFNPPRPWATTIEHEPGSPRAWGAALAAMPPDLRAEALGPTRERYVRRLLEGGEDRGLDAVGRIMTRDANGRVGAFAPAWLVAGRPAPSRTLLFTQPGTVARVVADDRATWVAPLQALPEPEAPPEAPPAAPPPAPPAQLSLGVRRTAAELDALLDKLVEVAARPARPEPAPPPPPPEPEPEEDSEARGHRFERELGEARVAAQKANDERDEKHRAYNRAKAAVNEILARIDALAPGRRRDGLPEVEPAERAELDKANAAELAARREFEGAARDARDLLEKRDEARANVDAFEAGYRDAAEKRAADEEAERERKREDARRAAIELIQNEMRAYARRRDAAALVDARIADRAQQLTLPGVPDHPMGARILPGVEIDRYETRETQRGAHDTTLWGPPDGPTKSGTGWTDDDGRGLVGAHLIEELDRPDVASVNAPTFAIVEGNDGIRRRVIFKAAVHDAVGIRDAIDDDTIRFRERAAYLLDRMLGGEGVVPPTVEVNIEELDGLGSAQFVAKNVRSSGVASDYRGEAAFDESLSRMLLLDLVMANDDRHGKNWLVNTETGRVVAIDNGLTFPGRDGYERWEDKGGPCRFFVATENDEETARIADWSPDLWDRFQSIDPRHVARMLGDAGVNRSATWQTLERLVVLQRRPRGFVREIVARDPEDRLHAWLQRPFGPSADDTDPTRSPFYADVQATVESAMHAYRYPTDVEIGPHRDKDDPAPDEVDQDAPADPEADAKAKADAAALQAAELKLRELIDAVVVATREALALHEQVTKLREQEAELPEAERKALIAKVGEELIEAEAKRARLVRERDEAAAVLAQLRALLPKT